MLTDEGQSAVHLGSWLPAFIGRCAGESRDLQARGYGPAAASSGVMPDKGHKTEALGLI